MDSEKYMLRIAPEFKQKIKNFYDKLRNLAVSILIIPILLIIYFYIFPDNKIVSVIVLFILFAYILIFLFFIDRIAKLSPSFKEYVLYYFWKGKYFLNKYENEGASDIDIKTSISYFKKLELKLFQNMSTIKTYRFETEANMNKSVEWLKKWIDNYVIDSLKKRKTDTYQKVDDVFEGTYKYWIDEDFSKLCNFLKPHVKPYLKKSDNPIVNFFYWLHSSLFKCLIFYGCIIIGVIISAAIGIYLYWGSEVLFGIFTIISVIVFFIGLTITYFNKKFVSNDYNKIA